MCEAVRALLDNWICEEDGVPFTPWETFDDVRDALETMRALPGPVGGERCIGWRTA